MFNVGHTSTSSRRVRVLPRMEKEEPTAIPVSRQGFSSAPIRELDLVHNSSTLFAYFTPSSSLHFARELYRSTKVQFDPQAESIRRKLRDIIERPLILFYFIFLAHRLPKITNFDLAAIPLPFLSVQSNPHCSLRLHPRLLNAYRSRSRSCNGGEETNARQGSVAGSGNADCLRCGTICTIFMLFVLLGTNLCVPYLRPAVDSPRAQ